MLLYATLLSALLLFSAHTSIIETVKLSNPVTKQVIYLLSEQHDLDNEVDDREQLETFIKSLSYLSSQREALHIFVEMPPLGFCSYPKITKDIVHFISQDSITNIFGEDIEIRNVAKAAFSIFNSDYVDLALFRDLKISNSLGSCYLDKVTYNDLINEFNYYSTLLRNSENKCDSFFTEQLLKSQEHFQLFLEYIHKFDISSQDTICDGYLKVKHYINDNYASLIGSVNPVDTMSDLLLDAFSPLLELYIITRIIAVPYTRDLVIIAGSLHIYSLINFLLVNNWDIVGKSMVNPVNLVELDYKCLSYFDKFKREIQCCFKYIYT
jgi:hypothetical protein